MRALCVGRHRFISEHISTYFQGLGLETEISVGFDEAILAARAYGPDVVICDYDLLATLPLDAWESDELLSRLPVVAVSLARRPEEANLLAINAIAGFLYLPTLDPEQALRVLRAANRSVRLPADVAIELPLGTAAPSPR